MQAKNRTWAWQRQREEIKVTLLVSVPPMPASGYMNFYSASLLGIAKLKGAYQSGNRIG
jgi:hypothetical protein